MENQLFELLPTEVAQIAQSVSSEKRNEVKNVLNDVFNGVSKMREQLDLVVVSDINDNTSMKVANTIRLGVRKVRLEAEKLFDAKRSEVQAQMLGYKTEDQLWLKAKQTMQILTKEIEENARWKEETRLRFEAEQKELKIKERTIRLSQIAPEIPRSEFEFMGDETFETFFLALENKNIEKIELEKKAEEERIAKIKAEAEEREKIRIENERLRKEAEEKERIIAQEKAKAEAELKAAQEKARKEREAAELKAAQEKAKQDAIIEAERKEKAKLEAELKAKAEAERKAKKEAEEKAAAELKAKKDAERKAKSAPDKAKLEELAKKLESMELPVVKSEEAQNILDDTIILLNRISKHIREKYSNL